MNDKKAIIVLVLAVIIIVACSVIFILTNNTSENNFYTVTFADETGNVIITQKIEEGAKAQIPNNPTKEGYIFVKW